jgi:hypothetical protein
MVISDPQARAGFDRLDPSVAVADPIALWAGWGAFHLPYSSDASARS